MAKRLDVTYSSKKDAEIVRFLELNADQNISPIIISAIEYYIITGNYLEICRVHIADADEEERKIRKPIYVQQNSPVYKWSERLKEQKHGLMPIKVKQVLKNSITIVDSAIEESKLSMEECILACEELYQTREVAYVPEYETLERVPIIVPSGIKKYSPSKKESTQKGAASVIATKKEAAPEKDKDNETKSLLDTLMPTDDWT